MTLGEVLCKKYALTSFKVGGCSLAILAINEALEAAAMLAAEQTQIDVAARIRSLKWSKSDNSSPSEPETPNLLDAHPCFGSEMASSSASAPSLS